MIIEKIKVFFAKHKAIKLLLWLALLGGLLCFAWWLYQGSIKQYFKNIEINDTTRGIIGTLLGAIVGGYFVNQIVEYIVHNGMLRDLSVLQEPPFTDLGSIVDIFTDLTVWAGIRRTIETINTNAIAA